MKKLGAILAFTGLLCFSFGEIKAQQPAPPAVTGSQFARQAAGYNPSTVETLRGQVIEVKQNVPRKEGGKVKLQLVVKTERETLTVFLGPARYVERQQVTFAAGDQVEVKGSRLMGPQKTLIIAAEITKAGKVLKLRDEMTGKPLWSKGY